MYLYKTVSTVVLDLASASVSSAGSKFDSVLFARLFSSLPVLSSVFVFDVMFVFTDKRKHREVTVTWLRFPTRKCPWS